MKVLSKKKLLKQYGFPRMYALTLGAPRLGAEEEGMVLNYFCVGVGMEGRKQGQWTGDGLEEDLSLVREVFLQNQCLDLFFGHRPSSP